MSYKVRIKLQEVLDKEERTLAWVSKKTGIAYTTLHKLNSNKTNAISFNVIEQICELFKCDIEDIMYIDKDYKEQQER